MTSLHGWNSSVEMVDFSHYCVSCRDLSNMSRISFENNINQHTVLYNPFGSSVSKLSAVDLMEWNFKFKVIQ